MTPETPTFPEYGDRGDTVGAGRSRRAFRLCIFSLVLLAGLMWFSEKFLRYDQAERLYQRALTLNPESSARVFLLQAIRLDQEQREKPTPKYHHALAVRQERDVILQTYQQAVELDPTNSFFRIRYGCQLFVMGRTDQARDQFRRAGELPPSNSLPGCLEAACIARAATGAEEISDAIAQVARFNHREDKLVFPKPLWSSDYPEAGKQYAYLQRRIYDNVSAPLYVLANQIIAAARAEIASEDLQHSRLWLAELERLGVRLVLDSEPRGLLPALAGVQFQLQALDTLASLEETQGGQLSTDQLERRERLREALELMRAFENDRQERIATETQQFQRLWALVGWGTLLVVVVYLVAFTIRHAMRPKRTIWTIPHSRTGLMILAGGFLILLTLLHVQGAWIRSADVRADQATLGPAWWGVLALLLAAGCIYPMFTLPKPSSAAWKAGRPESMEAWQRPARRAYAVAYVTMAYRYLGILAGLNFATVSIWFLSFRIIHTLYPSEINLLVTGLLQEERQLVERVASLIA